MTQSDNERNAQSHREWADRMDGEVRNLNGQIQAAQNRGDQAAVQRLTAERDTAAYTAEYHRGYA